MDDESKILLERCSGQLTYLARDDGTRAAYAERLIDEKLGRIAYATAVAQAKSLNPDADIPGWEHEPADVRTGMIGMAKAIREQVLQEVASLLVSATITRQEDKNTNTGLPCRTCGVRQQRIDIERHGNAVRVRLSADVLLHGLKSLIKVLKEFAS